MRIIARSQGALATVLIGPERAEGGGVEILKVRWINASRIEFGGPLSGGFGGQFW